jgi:hypothetical protein
VVEKNATFFNAADDVHEEGKGEEQPEIKDTE